MGYRIVDSDSDITPSSIHTAPDTPSSFVTFPTPEYYSKLHSEKSNINPREHLQMIELELAESQARSKAMGQALEAILHKPNINSKIVSQKQPEIHKSPPGTPRSNSGTPVRHVKVKPATPSDFNRDQEEGRALLNTCTIYLIICGDSFPNEPGSHLLGSLLQVWKSSTLC